MNITETHLKGCFVIDPQVFEDNRGDFFESYQKKKLDAALGYTVNFVQTNQSVSKKGVLRGLHFQKGAYAQAKLVRVVKGEALDVVVDIRKDSITFGQHVKVKLSESNKKSVFVPKGMAHGFLTLSKEVIFLYQCDNYYNKNAEGGIIYNDEDLAIDWGLSKDQLILSTKDTILPPLKKAFL